MNNGTDCCEALHLLWSFISRKSLEENLCGRHRIAARLALTAARASACETALYVSGLCVTLLAIALPLLLSQAPYGLSDLFRNSTLRAVDGIERRTDSAKNLSKFRRLGYPVKSL